MGIRLEHANLRVSHVDEMVRFVRAAFPDFEIRGEGESLLGARWLHLGTEDTYLALTQARANAPEPWVPYAGKPGMNHLGYEVDDVEAVRRRLAAAGYHESTVPNDHPHRRRVYFRDYEGNDWEFVEYSSDDRAQRNDYALAD